VVSVILLCALCGAFCYKLLSSLAAQPRILERIDSPMKIKILDVGQCGFDGPRMSRIFKEKLDASVDVAATGEEAARSLAAKKFNLVLVNRVLAADGESGIELIDELVKSGCTTPLMLVSDRPDAQDQAVARGALRGFGKAALTKPETFELLKTAAQAPPQGK
jgi:CheY-like chemotaxis protein